MFQGCSNVYMAHQLLIVWRKTYVTRAPRGLRNFFSWQWNCLQRSASHKFLGKWDIFVIFQMTQLSYWIIHSFSSSEKCKLLEKLWVS
jgi:cytolysin (calcineurin-like family phosphatase)